MYWKIHSQQGTKPHVLKNSAKKNKAHEKPTVKFHENKIKWIKWIYYGFFHSHDLFSFVRGDTLPKKKSLITELIY